jgi:hypothetical protein
MTIIVEVNRPWQSRPGYFYGTVAGQTFRRVWWGYIALAWTPLSLPDYQAACASGQVEWQIR